MTTATGAEGKLMRTLARLLPEARGYRDPEARADTDERLRAHVAAELERLQARVLDLKGAAGEEGEEDMVDELDKLDVRLIRTIEALRGASYEAEPFFSGTEAAPADLERVCAYDQELLDDLALLSTDVMGLKYETIGNLTLREAEGTLAAIELKVTNRRYIFQTGAEA